MAWDMRLSLVIQPQPEAPALARAGHMSVCSGLSGGRRQPVSKTLALAGDTRLIKNSLAASAEPS